MTSRIIEILLTRVARARVVRWLCNYGQLSPTYPAAHTMRMLDCLLIFFLASITATSAGEIEKKISSRIFSGEPVDLGSTSDFLTNDNISYSFTVLLIAQVQGDPTKLNKNRI